MPFTPFHMGAALIVKPGLNRNFSVITFGIAQIAMDIEPGAGMITGADVLHGASHTFLGALIIACFVMIIAPSICSFLIRRWNKEVTHYNFSWLVESESVPKIAVIVGALFGTLSHVVLDGLMHHDMQPLLPFSKENPLIGLITHDGVYLLTAMTGFLGGVAWLALKWFNRSPEIVDIHVQQKPQAADLRQDFLGPWVRELQSTWLWLFFVSILPCLLFGTAFFSMIFLVGAVLIGVPVTVIGQVAGKGSKKSWRRLIVMVSVPLLAINFALQVDKQTPDNAAPIANAIELYKVEVGHYPESLKALAPSYLATVPYLRLCVIQPDVIYRVVDGKPYLAIPSAAGDVFARYEYNFETKVWIHFS